MSYALVSVPDGAIIKEYGSAVPSVVVWPNGDASACPVVGDERGAARLVRMVMVGEKPDDFHHLESVRNELSGNTLEIIRVAVPDDLEDVRKSLLMHVDIHAEAQRLKHITPGIGQAIVYLEKLREVEAFQGGAKVGFPFLEASIPEGGSISDAVDEVLAAAEAWRTIAAAIERVRLSAKARIRAAKSTPESVAVWKAVQWPS